MEQDALNWFCHLLAGLQWESYPIFPSQFPHLSEMGYFPHNVVLRIKYGNVSGQNLCPANRKHCMSSPTLLPTAVATVMSTVNVIILSRPGIEIALLKFITARSPDCTGNFLKARSFLFQACTFSGYFVPFFILQIVNTVLQQQSSASFWQIIGSLPSLGVKSRNFLILSVMVININIITMFDRCLTLIRLQFLHSELHRWLSLFPK